MVFLPKFIDIDHNSNVLETGGLRLLDDVVSAICQESIINSTFPVWSRFIYIYIPGTQMTLVLIGKGLVLEGPWLKIEDKQVPGN